MTHRLECDICNGSRRIKLPIYRRMTTRDNDMILVEPVQSSRSYPCPECSPKVTDDHVRVLHAEHDLTIYPSSHEKRIERATQGTLAMKMADHLLRDGLISFKTGMLDESRHSKTTRATLGVVSKEHVATLEERVASHRQTTAETVAGNAQAKISNWGSHYTGGEGSISKEMACRMVREALAEAIKK